MKITFLCLVALQYVASHPLSTLEDLEIADDTVAVASYVREVRAAAPDHYHKETEDEGEGEIGYSRLKEGGGKKGYQHFDAYHKKAGDNYALEKEDSFGYEDEGQEGAYSEHQEKKAEQKQKPKQKPKRDPEYEDHERERTNDDEHDEKDRHKYDTKERHYEELKQGASDGNGGVEAQGHDQRDYVLPEKYTWGKDDEYAF